MSPIQPKPDDLRYTLRRYYVDVFQEREIASWTRGSDVLDLGGTKKGKRGDFNIDDHGMKVVHANITSKKEPDVIADAAMLPFAGASFDGVICAELLEHVYQPPRVLEEVARVLRPGGRLMITVPFMMQVHADPEDYGRYTDFYWRRVLEEKGFEAIRIEKQGYFGSVLLDMLRTWAVNAKDTGARGPVPRGVVEYFVKRGRREAIRKLREGASAGEPVLHSFTTGFGIVAIHAGASADR